MITFLIIFSAFGGVATVLMSPALIYAHRQSRSWAWADAFVHVPAFVALYWLDLAGFGRPASLGNLIEYQILGVAAVALVYLKAFVIDTRNKMRALTFVACMILLIGFAGVLRLVMPTMPE